MRKLAALPFLLIAALGAGAQTPTEDLMKAQDAYEKSQYEQARNLFSSIISSRQQVTPEQKVIAFTYLGAYWALKGNDAASRDSANSFFIAALDYDPFTTLDRNKFAADEQAAFARAKAAKFKVGIRPIEWKAIDPTSSRADSARYNFQLVTTHQARLVMEIVSLTDPNKKETLPNATNDGVRDVPWDGLINTQRADTGLYEFRVTAYDELPGRQGQPPLIESQKFRIDHFHAPLEDTLSALTPADLLQSARPALQPISDGAKGLFVATIAGGLGFAALSNRKDMSSWGSHIGIGISLGAIAGTGAAIYAAKHTVDTRAEAENTRRRTLRTQFNGGVMARNRARLDKTILIIRPLTSAGLGN